MLIKSQSKIHLHGGCSVHFYPVAFTDPPFDFLRVWFRDHFFAMLHFVTADISLMSFGNPSELCLLARICFVHLIWFSDGACPIFVASTESTAMHLKHAKMCRPCCGSRGKIHQPFSPRFYMLQAIKNRTQGRPRDETSMCHFGVTFTFRLVSSYHLFLAGSVMCVLKVCFCIPF